jgi:DNA-binding MarR family transcriptional regulator
MNASRPDGGFVLPEPLLEFPSFLVFQVAREVRKLAGTLHPDGMRAPHVAVLACLAEFGASSQKDISERLRIDASDLVSLLDELEQRELASRTRDLRDRRRYVVRITEEGRQTLHSRLVITHKLNDLLLAPLADDERAELLRLLLKVYAHHDPGRVPARFSAVNT